MFNLVKHRAAGGFRLCGVLIAATVAIIVQAGVVSAQDAVAIPGTSVTITPPEGFTVATDFTGLANVEKQGSFLVAEFPAEAAAQLGGLFADESTAAASFATKGITISGREEIDNADGDTVPLLRGTQDANGVTLEKWMALYAGEKVVMVTFQIPQDKALEEDAMKGAFASVRLAGAQDAAAEGDQRLAGLPYEIEAVAPFRVVDVIDNRNVLMTVGEKDSDPQATQPQIVVTYSVTNAPKSELKRIAEVVLNGVGDNVAIESQEEDIFAGLDGLTTKGTLDEHGVSKRFVQWVAYTESGAPIQVLGTAATDKYEELSEAIEGVAASVEIKE